MRHYVPITGPLTVCSKSSSSHVWDLVICNKLFLILWQYPYQIVNMPFATRNHVLQHYHCSKIALALYSWDVINLIHYFGCRGVNLPFGESRIKKSSFCMIAHRLFFLRDICWSVQLWICTNTPELYDFNVASVFDFSCSPGWSNSKISSENYTNTAESISNEPGVLIPHAHCLGSAIIAFSVLQTKRPASINTPKICYLHWNT